MASFAARPSAIMRFARHSPAALPLQPASQLHRRDKPGWPAPPAAALAAARCCRRCRRPEMVKPCGLPNLPEPLTADMLFEVRGWLPWRPVGGQAYHLACHGNPLVAAALVAPPPAPAFLLSPPLCKDALPLSVCCYAGDGCAAARRADANAYSGRSTGAQHTACKHSCEFGAAGHTCGGSCGQVCWQAPWRDQQQLQRTLGSAGLRIQAS